MKLTSGNPQPAKLGIIQKFATWGYYLGSIFTMLFGFRNWWEVIRIFLFNTSGKLSTLQVRKPRLMINIRGRMDAWSVKEALLDRFYTRCGTEIDEGWTVMDIGAAIGEFTLLAALHASKGRVIAYEPFSGSFDLLKDNLSLNSIDNVTIHKLAVWSKDEDLELDFSLAEPLQMKSEKPGSGNAHSHLMSQSISLHQALAQNHVNHLDLLKLDCEGAEFPILLDAEPCVLLQVDRVILEYHDGYQGHHHQELVELLSIHGYYVNVTPNVVHAELGYLYAEKINPKKNP
jgi:FkbM family methyltransferase